MTRCGIVALAGKPNAGKSTLLNALVGQDLAIISPKPQTTREPVRGLLTEGDTQILFVDPAGLLDPGYALQAAMVHAAREVIHDADLVLHVHPATDGPAPPLERLLDEGVGASKRRSVESSRVLTVYTKMDLAPHFDAPTSDASTFFVSAKTRSGLDELLRTIRAKLPEGPFLYSPDDAGTQPLRFFAAEFIREAAYAILEQELPYSLAVEIEEFREDETPVYIRATLAVERDSQKPIVLGRGGQTIKKIGTAARQRLEAFIGNRVRLELWVTVWPKWRKDAGVLARLNLPLPPDNTR